MMYTGNMTDETSLLKFTSCARVFEKENKGKERQDKRHTTVTCVALPLKEEFV